MADEIRQEIEKRVADLSEPQIWPRVMELQALGRNQSLRPDGLLEDELTEIVALYARLRRKKSGPPTEAKTRKRARLHNDLSHLPL